jgi:pimeloyl-ACP methyl ester carboxylesterase
LSGNSLVFRSAKAEAAYLEAYDAALALWPVPYEELEVPTRFGGTHVILSGPASAPPAVLLPGNFASATMWHSCVAELSRHHRIYAVNIVGDLGKSVATRLPSSRTDFAVWLTDLFDRLGLQRSHLVGASYGGFLALNFAMSAPQRVDRIVLLCPGVPSFAPPTPRWALYGLPMTVSPSRLTVEWFYRGASARHHVGDPAIFRQWVLGVQALARRIPFRPAFGDDEFPALKMPVLMLVGDREIMYDARSAVMRAKQLIPGIEAEIIPGAGHLLLQDQPEMVAERIIQSLGEKTRLPTG